jgi:phage replication O-like protein O
MANPQLENGYTSIANEIMERLAKARIPGEARQILDVIFRKTYGFHKKEDRISNSQFVELTGINKYNVCRAIKKLITMNVVIKKDNAVIKKDNNCYPKRYPQKIKDTITKDKRYIMSSSRKKIVSNGKIPYHEIIDRLNKKTNSSYKSTTGKYKLLIKARWNEGYKVEDFFYVIDIKTEEWAGNPDWEKFLRPETLFGTKFGSYRNQKKQLTKEERDEILRLKLIDDYYKKHPEEREK